jgi:hypothetical protein
LAELICPAYGLRPDRRGLRRLREDGTVWVTCKRPQLYHVFFHEQHRGTFAQVNHHNLDKKPHEKRKSRQKPQKGE